MQERDSLSFGAHARFLIDQSDTCTATAIQCSVQVIDGEANVVDAGPAFGDELANWRIGALCLEQLHERVARAEASDTSPVGVVQGLFR